MPGIRLTTGVVYDANGGGMHNQGRLSYDRLRARYMVYSTRPRLHGIRKKRMWKEKEEVSTEIDPNKKYTPGQLDDIASAILREDSKTELCRDCGARGEETGESKVVVSPESKDEAGNVLAVKFSELSCENGHSWYSGEGQMRGIQGDNPILFEEHFQSRRRREIYTVIGTPDPSIVQGIYNRTHPQGRKVNSEVQRKRNGASYYR